MPTTLQLELSFQCQVAALAAAMNKPPRGLGGARFTASDLTRIEINARLGRSAAETIEAIYATPNITEEFTPIILGAARMHPSLQQTRIAPHRVLAMLVDGMPGAPSPENVRSFIASTTWGDLVRAIPVVVKLVEANARAWNARAMGRHLGASESYWPSFHLAITEALNDDTLGELVSRGVDQ